MSEAFVFGFGLIVTALCVTPLIWAARSEQAERRQQEVPAEASKSTLER